MSSDKVSKQKNEDQQNTLLSMYIQRTQSITDIRKILTCDAEIFHQLKQMFFSKGIKKKKKKEHSTLLIKDQFGMNALTSVWLGLGN